MSKIKLLVFNEDENKNISPLEETSKNMEFQCSLYIFSAMVFIDLTRDIDVNYFTGFKKSDFLIWFLNICQTRQEQCVTEKGYQIHQVIYRPLWNLKMWSLTLEPEFLLTMVRLRLGLLIGDLAHRLKF